MMEFKQIIITAFKYIGKSSTTIVKRLKQLKQLKQVKANETIVRSPQLGDHRKIKLNVKIRKA